MGTPSSEALHRFATGQSAWDEAEEVARWLELNPDAFETVRRDADADTLVQAIRSAASLQIQADWNIEAVIRAVEEQTKADANGAPTQAFAFPTQLGQFRIQTILGRGGMGMVCAAMDERLGRQVAIKFIRTDLTHVDEYRARFLQETRAVAAIEHESIVPILSAGEVDGINYIVMPLLNGETLAARLQRGPLQLPSLVKLATDLVSGLHAAHCAGIIHRDVKPSNVWLERTTDGALKRARLLDFGLARSLESAEPITKTHQVMGTPGYMAPELARGNAAGPPADVFSLGCVLYEAAVGRRPFVGNNMLDVLLKIQDAELEPISQHRPDLPAAFSHLVAKMLAKDPDQRPQRLSEIVATLEQLAHSQSLGAGSGGPIRQTGSNRSGRSMSSRKAILLGALGSAAALTLLGILITIRHSNGTETKIQLEGNATVTVRESGDVQIDLPDSQTPAAKPTPSVNAPPSSSERTSLIKLLEIGAHVQICRPDGRQQIATSLEDFPEGSFIHQVIAVDNPNFTDDFFAAHVAPLKQLRLLQVSGATRLTDASRFFQAIGEFTQLTHLGTNLPLDDSGCERLSQCTELSGLYWVSPRFTEEGAQHLVKLRKLTELKFLEGNVRDAALAPLLELPLLRSFWIKNCALSGQFLKCPRVLPTITEIDLSYCRFSEDPFQFLQRFPNLQVLLYESLQDTGRNLKHLANAPNLRVVSLHSSRISDIQGLAQLARAPRLETLNLHASRSIGDEHVQALSAINPENLIHLDLSGTRVTNASIDSILKLPRLRFAGLWDVDIDDAGFIKLASSKTLRELHLGSKTLTNATISALAAREIPWEVLWIFEGQLTDDSIDELAKMQGLRTLGVRSTRISPAGFQRLKTLLPNTEILP